MLIHFKGSTFHLTDPISTHSEQSQAVRFLPKGRSTPLLYVYVLLVLPLQPCALTDDNIYNHPPSFHNPPSHSRKCRVIVNLCVVWCDQRNHSPSSMVLSALKRCRSATRIISDRFVYAKLRIVWQLDKGIENHQMIKLTLQPLVENSIYHGIETLDHGGQITIEGRMQEGMICFHIRDDGVGIGEEQLAHIRRVLIDGETRQIGLKNVDNRIKLYFGEQYGVRIESEANVGTTVTLTLPLQSFEMRP